VWFRGRTVAALLALTTLVACAATYAVLEWPGWTVSRAGAGAGDRSPGGPEGLRQDEMDKINKAVSLIERRFSQEADRSKLLDGAIQGMVESLGDPYSVYKPESEAEKFNETLQGTFTGIGAELKIVKGEVVVEAPIRGTPAERAGLQPGDVLLSVNGASLTGLSIGEAVEKIRGPKGTKAKLKVRRAGIADAIDLELVRDRIDPQTVDAEALPGGIGVLTINQFGEETAAEVEEVLGNLQSKGLRALIVDVRDNPGGNLQAVVEVADQLLQKGKPIVQYEYRNGERKTDEAEKGAGFGQDLPIVVLTNKGSASAAEILAGALKQSAGALLVGEKTYGKGMVQVPFPGELGDRSLVKLTVYKWLLPDGAWIDGKGIEPDVAVSQPDYFLAWRLPRETTLKYDETGEDVANLQTILEGIGYPADRKDGYFSQRTKESVERFQKSESLPATGEVDSATAERLEERLYSNLQNRENDVQWQAAYDQVRKLLEAKRGSS